MVDTTRERWSRVRGTRVRTVLVLLVVDAVLVLAVVAGWHAVQDQRIRHGADTRRVVATVTDTVRQCSKGGCRWVSLGSYEVAGHVERDVVVVDGSRHEIRTPQTVLVDPAHPRHAVNLHDHGVVWIVLAAAAVVGLVVVNTLAWRRWRRRRSAPRAVPVS